MSAAQSVVASFSLPDLAITRLGVLPSAPYTGDDVTISVDVANLTAANASTFRIEFYVDDSWQGCWYLGVPPREYFARVASLAGNASATWSFTVPGGTLSAGAHTFNAYVDMGCELSEANEANNSAGPLSVTFTVPAGGAFNLSSPVNAAANQPVNPTLRWGTSSGADSYEYCINTSASCSAPASWTSTSTSTSVALSGLTPGARYFWQVRARNSSGLTYANGDSSAWWSFVVLAPPGVFYKASPVNNAIDQPSTLALTWTASSNADSYEYCVNSVMSCALWTSAGTNTGVALNGLTPGLHYWQVRATNTMGTIYANGGNFKAFFVSGPPGTMYKVSPSNNATNQPSSLNLAWTASVGASAYQYCINPTASCPSWTSTAAATSVALTGLVPGRYYWQVRATNAAGSTFANGGNMWTFLVTNVASGFNKVGPANAALNQPVNPVLTWQVNRDAVSYDYCLSAVAGCTAPAAWVSTGTATSVALGGLTPGATYYWQVRAINGSGTTYADAGDYWSFTVVGGPGILFKISPLNNAANQLSNLTLSWSASVGAGSYQYCVNTTASCTGWTSAGTNTSVALTGQAPGLHYWQVRAVNAFGTTYANGGNYWAFNVVGPPGILYKLTPANNAVNQPSSVSLTWTTSAYASSYEYCINTTPVCSSWVPAGTNTGVALNGLAPGLHYWQVRALNAMGTTYANGGNWRSFSSLP